MKRVIPLISVTAVAACAAAILAASGPKEDQICVARSPMGADQAREGYELIDFVRREAWVTRDWTLEAYEAFSTGLTAPHWIKNDPRMGYAARTTVLRSPDCDAEGDFTYQAMYGREFFHIANLVSIGPDYADGILREAAVVKYHQLDFEAGQSPSLLVSPDGTAFVRVNRPVNAVTNDNPVLPDGWRIVDVTLQSAWRATLFDRVSVLQLKSGVSYQGPVDPPPSLNVTGALSLAGEP